MQPSRKKDRPGHENTVPVTSREFEGCYHRSEFHQRALDEKAEYEADIQKDLCAHIHHFHAKLFIVITALQSRIHGRGTKIEGFWGEEEVQVHCQYFYSDFCNGYKVLPSLVLSSLLSLSLLLYCLTPFV